MYNIGMSKLTPCHRILRRRTKVIMYNGKALEITEPSAKDYDAFLELVSNTDKMSASELEVNDRKLIKLLNSWITDGEIPEVISEDFASVLIPAVAEISDSNVIYSNSTGKQQTPDPIDAPDASLLRMIDLVAHHYGTDPLEVYARYSYRQINYLFVMAYNHMVYQNYAGGKEPPKVLNAKGLMIDNKTLPQKEKIAYFGRLRIQQKEQENG